MSVLDPAPDFEAEDSVLHAVLGLLVVGGQIRAALDSVEVEAPVEAPTVDDAMLYAMLGIIRLRSKVLGVVESWATEEPTPEIARDGAPEPLEGILR